MNDVEPDVAVYERGRARLNPTVAALMQRGLDSEQARKLRAARRNFARLD